MRVFFRKATPLQLQLLIWGILILISFFTYLPMDGIGQSATYAVLNTFFYALTIYGNISLLFPRLYERGRIALYVLAAAAMLIGIGVIRALIYIPLYNRYFAGANMKETLSLQEFVYFILGGLVIYTLSFVFRIALAYFGLKRQAEQMLEQKSQAELNLLKSQVQPHFLFNTLNNIYYEAFREAPRTALLIGRLSDIMRYFVDESPKEKVFLSTEVKFLENYIALEEIRIRHGVKVIFHQHFEGNPVLPPMLLMTFVENIFKHGIDRSAAGNEFSISLQQQDGFLLFTTDNNLPEETAPSAQPGFGLKNLEKRLILLYGNRFELRVTRTDSAFIAFLKIPLI